MLAGLQQHALQQYAVGVLNLGAPGDRDPRRAQALGELVSHPLELIEVEQAWPPALGARELDAAEAVGGQKGIGELALEPRDLLGQRATRGSLVESRAAGDATMMVSPCCRSAIKTPLMDCLRLPPSLAPFRCLGDPAARSNHGRGRATCDESKREVAV
jgi:hypothetical protein